MTIPAPARVPGRHRCTVPHGGVPHGGVPHGGRLEPPEVYAAVA
jgi:hypothetical protein